MTKPTAFELFRQFQPKFRKVTLRPMGFPIHEQTARFYFHVATSVGYVNSQYPSIDLMENGLSFVFTYDPTNKTSDPTTQMIMAIWDALMAGPFAGREFYADPRNLASVHQEFQDRIAGKYYNEPSIPVSITYSGDPIPGLAIPGMTTNWRFFVPDNTKECKTIATALALEQTEFQRNHAQALVEDTGNYERAAADFYDSMRAAGIWE